MAAERWLKGILRVIGAAAMLALAAVFMPFAWMAWAHERLGLGALPHVPILEYLARTASAFYFMLGALLWLLAGDVRRYGPMITALGAFMVVFGVIIFIFDLSIDMPLYWVLAEGPPTVAMGVALVALEARVKAAVRSPRGARRLP